MRGPGAVTQKNGRLAFCYVSEKKKKIITTVLKLQWSRSSVFFCHRALKCIQSCARTGVEGWPVWGQRGCVSGSPSGEREEQGRNERPRPRHRRRHLRRDKGDFTLTGSTGVQRERRMAASTIGVWSIQSVAPGGNRSASLHQITACCWHLLLRFKRHCWQTKFPMFSAKVPKAISGW